MARLKTAKVTTTKRKPAQATKRKATLKLVAGGWWTELPGGVERHVRVNKLYMSGRAGSKPFIVYDTATRKDTHYEVVVFLTPPKMTAREKQGDGCYTPDGFTAYVETDGAIRVR